MSNTQLKPSHAFKSLTYTGLNPGPRIIITGAVHGNETCGTKAIQRVISDVDSGKLQIASGRVTFVPITNPLAYSRGERMGDRNLNRNLGLPDQPSDFEDHIANWLCPLFAQHDVLLDLHSTRAQNPAFAMLGPQNTSSSIVTASYTETLFCILTLLPITTALPIKTFWPSEQPLPIRAPAQTWVKCHTCVASPRVAPSSTMALKWMVTLAAIVMLSACVDRDGHRRPLALSVQNGSR